MRSFVLGFVNVLGHTFCPSLMARSVSVVIDCGANVGSFARYCSSRLGARVYSYEADPALALQLPELPRVVFENAAVAGKAGHLEVYQAPGKCSSVRFHKGNYPANHEGAGDKPAVVPAVTLDDIMEKYELEVVDLLKLDIEGAELDVLEGASRETLLRCRQITCEFHDHVAPSDRPRIERIIALLRSDFVIVCMSIHTYGDVLMINRSVAAGWWAVRLQMLMQKFHQGALRVARRLASRHFGRHSRFSF